MEIVANAASVGRSQSALKLITEVVQSAKTARHDGPLADKPWSTHSAASLVSSRSASAIQNLVQANFSDTVTFKELGGAERTVPRDEYEFAAQTAFQTIDEVREYFFATETDRLKALLADVKARNLTESIPALEATLESWTRSMANGTVKIELMDDRVAGRYSHSTTRFADGSISGLSSQIETPMDQKAFLDVYGDGKGGFDRNVAFGANYFIRGFVIIWEK